METRTVPEDQWLGFLDRFSREHAGWPITIQVLDQQQGAHELAHNLPLQGMSFDTKGTRPCAIDISAGENPNAHVNHVVDLPLNIRVAEEPNGDVDLEIEPAKGPVTLLHLRSPIH